MLLDLAYAATISSHFWCDTLHYNGSLPLVYCIVNFHLLYTPCFTNNEPRLTSRCFFSNGKPITSKRSINNHSLVFHPRPRVSIKNKIFPISPYYSHLRLLIFNFRQDMRQSYHNLVNLRTWGWILMRLNGDEAHTETRGKYVWNLHLSHLMNVGREVKGQSKRIHLPLRSLMMRLPWTIDCWAGNLSSSRDVSY